MDLSFIIVNYGTPNLVNRLVDSIHEFKPGGRFEIIVVDNKSPDNSVEIIRTAYPDIRLVALEKNIGFGAGNNRGAAISSGGTLILVNSDCVLKEECFDKPVRFLNGNPEIGILGIKVYKPDGELEQNARGFPLPLTGVFGRSTFLGKLAQRSGLGKAGVAKKNLQVDPSKTEPYEVDWVSGTVMLLSRKCWDAIGGFDEDYFMYWEDADICARALKAGYKTFYFPGSQIFHEAGGSTRSDPVPAIRWFHQSAYKYIVKNISPGPSFVRAFGWCALNLRAKILIARARKKSAS